MSMLRAMCCLGVMGCGGESIFFSPSPCSDGRWAGWAVPYGVIWVSPDGADTGPGSIAKPLRTIRAAMEVVRRTRSGRIGLLPGVHEGGVRIFRDNGKPVTISGCSAAEVVIQGSNERPATATLSLQGSGEITVRNLSIEQGTGGITITGGVQATLESVTVSSAAARGILIGGEDTVASLTDVTVQNTVDGMRSRPKGWGLGIIGASVTLTDVRLLDNRGFGLNMDGGELNARQLVIERTASTGVDRFGTGLYARHARRVSLSACAVRESAGDGVFLIDNQEVVVRDCVIDQVSSSSFQPGDGLVVRQVGTERAETPVTLSGNVVTNAARLGIALAGPLTVALTDNQADDSNGAAVAGHARFATDNAVVTGDSTHPLDLEEYRVGMLYRPR